MASCNMLRAGSFQYRSGPVNYITIRSGSRIKTLPYKFIGANPFCKFPAQESTRFPAPFRQFSTTATRQKILFTERFDVKGGAVSYRRLIEGTRQKIASAITREGLVRMLNTEQENPNYWFDIELIAGNNSQITLRMRCSDLYFIGFQEISGQWYEFNENNHAIFPKAQLLSFRSDYLSYFTKLEATRVGPVSLLSSVLSLSDYNPDNMDEMQLAIRLIRLIVIFPEALRFTTVERFVLKTMCHKTDSEIGSEIAHLVRKWGNLSMAPVYSNAVLATVQVKLINNWDNENSAKIYGTIDASNTLSDGPIALFNKKSIEHVNVKPQEMIPLQTYTVVVIFGYSIIIDANLKDRSSPDDPIVQGSVTFPAATSGSKDHVIRGKYGSVQVMVTWSIIPF